MPDEDEKFADEETTPDTSQGAYKEGREEDVKGDSDALQSNDPKDQQQDTLADDDEHDITHAKR